VSGYLAAVVPGQLVDPSRPLVTLVERDDVRRASGLSGAAGVRNQARGSASSGDERNRSGRGGLNPLYGNPAGLSAPGTTRSGKRVVSRGAHLAW